MSAILHEAQRTGNEIRTGYRLADLEKLADSPIISLALSRVAAFKEQGQHAFVGISTKDAVRQGADPTVCIIISPTRHGEFLNSYNPERWEYSRVDLVGESIGDHPLRVTVKGIDNRFREPGIPHKVTDMWEIEGALDQALQRPRPESTDVTPQLNGFFVKGFEMVRTPKLHQQ